MIMRLLAFLGFHVDRPDSWACDCDACLCSRCDLTPDLCPCPKCDVCNEVLYGHTRIALNKSLCRACAAHSPVEIP